MNRKLLVIVLSAVVIVVFILLVALRMTGQGGSLIDLFGFS
jgi:hypothetical protein